MSVDRFLAIRFPFRDLKYMKAAVTICGLIWAVGIGISFMEVNNFVYVTQEWQDITTKLCYSKLFYGGAGYKKWDEMRMYMFTLISLVFFLPFTVIIIFYSCLLGNVKRFYKKIGISDGHHKSNIRNIAKMIILVLVTTIACWLPLV